MIVKVCGMRDADNVQQVAQLGVDMMGFIFYPKSPRCFNDVKDTEDSKGSEESKDSKDDFFVLPRTEADENVKRVGVFVDAEFPDIECQILRLGLDAVQFHGNESPEFIKDFQEMNNDFLFNYIKPWLEEHGLPFQTKPLQVIKAISVSTAEDIQKYKEYVGAVDLFLFDTKCKTVGGSGQQFDWQVLEQYDGDVPFILSGGIGPEDAEKVKNFHHPKCIGIDLNSRFEIEPGLKDVEKLKTFLGKVKG